MKKEVDEQVVDNVREFGCHINIVFDPDLEQPDFAYSVGFEESVGQPEVIMFGLPHDLMKNAINETLNICQNGLELSDGTRVGGLLDGHHCVVRAVHPSRVTVEYFAAAICYQEQNNAFGPIRAIQLVWPGALNGLFPWDEGCAVEVQDLQPRLYEPRLDS